MKHRQTESLGQSQMLLSDSPQGPRGFIGYLQVVVFIAQSQSLKDRRQVIERIKHRAKNNFNISVGEKPCEMWKNCELFFICANYTKKYVLETIDHLEKFIRSYNEIQIIAIEKGVM